MNSVSSDFTSKENTRIARDSLRLLGRFISGLTLLRPFFPFSLFFVIVGALLPIFFLWCMARMAQCGSLTGCPAVLPYVGWNVTLDSRFLIYLVLVSTVIRIIGWILFEVPGQLATQPYHQKMVRGLGATRTTYFDENPSGRLLNRLVRDYDQVRLGAIIRIGDTINCVIELVSVAAVTVASHYLVGALILPLLGWIVFAQWHVSLMLQRCSVFRSSRFGEVLHRETDIIEGARTFLIYDRIPALLSRVRNAMYRYVQAHLLHMRVEGWGFLWTGLAGSAFLCVSVLVIGYQISHQIVDAVIAGVILTSLSRLAPTIGWTTWIFAYLLESVGQIRRVFEIIDLPREEEEEKSAARVASPDIPAHTEQLYKGDLTFDNYSMSYRKDSPLILNHLNLTLPAGKEIGIIGRTGAGKTSIMQSLFRMVFVQQGDIRIGGNSILDCPIDFTRKHFAVVPQDPYLFAGTVRSNLDPYGEHSESKLAEVIAQVGLALRSDSELREGGENLSRGERQLLCLARVLLGAHPFILMDEPTSGVDTITDAKIQEVLFHLLRGRTVITIAHRLNTLSQYDWIVELENGSLKGAGTPANMMNAGGTLRNDFK